MNIRQKTRIAKDLLKKSLTKDRVDNKKVTLILKTLVSHKPQGYIGILKVYKRLIESKINSETIIIESPVSISSSKKVESEMLKKTNAKKILFKTNPSLVFGAKITYGDWVWEQTLQTKLKQLWTS